MTPTDARALVIGAITDVAPELEPDDIGDDDELGADLDLDSIDFLRVVEAVAAATGRDIPEADYPQLSTLAAFTAYLTP